MRRLLRENRIWIALLLAALLLAGCTAEKPSAPAPTSAPPAAPTAGAAPEATSAPTPTPEPTLASVETPMPLPPEPPAPSPEPTPEPTQSPDLHLPTPTQPPVLERVDDTYFQDAAFLGNSLMDGLRLFGRLQYGDFYSGTSASVVSVNAVKDFKDARGEPCTRMSALLSKQYGKVYVLFGINELGFNIDGFIDIYSDVLAQLAEGEPDATIYVLSLTPITQKKDANNELFKRDRILEFNRAIEEMAARGGYIYLDLYDALADENGWLPEQQATDGIHFTADKYPEWAEYLRTHFTAPESTDSIA